VVSGILVLAGTQKFFDFTNNYQKPVLKLKIASLASASARKTLMDKIQSVTGQEIERSGLVCFSGNLVARKDPLEHRQRQFSGLQAVAS